MNVTYYAAASSDGFIAGENGDVSWLDELDIDMSEIRYEEFFASVDGLVMGRHSYDFVFDYGAWPYGDKLTWVLTSSELTPLEGANIRVSTSIEEMMSGAEDEGLEHLWLVGGGELASSFIEAGHLTHLSISEMPLELGIGIPLFARHSLEELEASEKVIDPRKGFRQILMGL